MEKEAKRGGSVVEIRIVEKFRVQVPVNNPPLLLQFPSE
jgi:hypothetical protein